MLVLREARQLVLEFLLDELVEALGEDDVPGLVERLDRRVCVTLSERSGGEYSFKPQRLVVFSRREWALPRMNHRLVGAL